MGGDGYLGWPVSLFLANKGHNILSIDNYDKRKLSTKIGIKPLFPTPKLEKRVEVWRKLTRNKNLNFNIFNICNFKKLLQVYKEFKPETIIHFAEQPSAPYSMKGFEEAAYTLQNNITSTFNIIYAARQSGIKPHIIKLGTMGEYGTPNIDIEEGYINILHKNREDKFLFPRQGGSLYHTSKIMDTDLLYFYVRAWDFQVTDLMQGPVYGLFTDETETDEALNTSFYYDAIFGTVINRFIIQAIKKIPLTVYGEGNQKRGYINIKDTLKCIDIAINNPPSKGELKIFNQFTEIFSINQIASLVKEAAKNLELNVNITNVKNPRMELEEHHYNPVNEEFKKLGLKSEKLELTVLEKMIKYLKKYEKNINTKLILPKVKWN